MVILLTKVESKSYGVDAHVLIIFCGSISNIVQRTTTTTKKKEKDGGDDWMLGKNTVATAAAGGWAAGSLIFIPGVYMMHKIKCNNW